MMTYAHRTSVRPESTRVDIERTLVRYGADAFSYATDNKRSMVQFRMNGRIIKYQLTMPPIESFAETPSRRWTRDKETQHQMWEAACRQQWRALLLIIRAKLEAIDTRITSFEEEFLAWTMLPDGSTVGERTLPQLHEAYETGKMPKALISGEDR